ncbi:MAG: efflux RND transporter permease subunit [Cytophagales bacterium]|nr:MAG: efflux RND transporter permease subunit [Cytophagales bacterium]
MRLVDFSVKNYQFTIIIFIMVLALGLNSLFNMPKSEDPEMIVPFFLVVAVYPGTTPTDMEELLVKPIEDVMYELENIAEIKTDIEDGLMIMRIEFQFGSDREEKYGDVVRELNNLRNRLPQDIPLLEVRKFAPSDVVILQAALQSETAPYKELEKYGEILKDKFEKVKSLKNATVQAFPEQQVRISVNLEKMAQNKIPINRVIQAIQSEATNIPAGSIEIGAKKFNVKTSGKLLNLEEIREIVVHANGTEIVKLKDIADISFNYEEETHIASFNGKRAVFVTASMKDKQNIFAVRAQMKPILEEFEKELPKHITFSKVFDQSESVAKRMGNFTRDFIIAIFLVLLTLLPLGWRASLVVMISIPLSLAIGLAILDYLGYSINQLSIVGMVVALGLLVDDSIVVVENIERFLRLGHPRLEASIEATKQIGMAVLGCTAVLILAFLPLAFLPEAAGEFIRSMPMAVITTVLASLFVSITIVPFLSSLILSKEAHPEGNLFLRLLKRFISGSYRKILNKALAYPILTLIISGLIFVGALALIPFVGMSVFPKSDKPQFLISLEAPLGTNLYETQRMTKEIEQVLKKKEAIKSYTTNVGKGNPRVYYNIGQKNEAANYAEFFVQLEEMDKNELEHFIDELREDFKDYSKARIEVKQFEQGPPLEAPIEVRIIGNHLDSLRKLAFEVENIIKNTEGTIYVNNPLTSLNTDVKVDINREKAGMLGIATAEIDRTVRLGIAGLNIATFQDEEGKEYNINITIPRNNRQDLEVFDKIYVSNFNGTLIPLKHLANIQLQKSPTLIRHFNKERYIVISSYVKSGFLTSRVTQEVIQKLEKHKFPKDYSYKMAGELENSQESFGGIGNVIIFTIFGILAILILEFRTFKSTLIVLSVVPLGIIGAVLILLITGNTFSFTAVIGMIALVGIEIKNSILLVDYTNQLRENGLSIDQAIEEAGETRFIPIILTTLTAIGGLIPLVLEESPLYSPLAWVIIGGLISSTLLTRLVTPVLYKLLPPKIDTKQ